MYRVEVAAANDASSFLGDDPEWLANRLSSIANVLHPSLTVRYLALLARCQGRI